MEVHIPSATIGKILCCTCAVPIEPNPSNQCIGCIRSKHDISEAIPKTGTLFFCRKCERYLEPPEIWVKASLESKELLRLCLKRIKGLNTVTLVDAGFAWTEAHSKRIKTKLKVQRQVESGVVLQQEFIVEFTITFQMCNDCHRVEAKDYWTALIQVRQKAEHKKTFYYLEQLIIKYKQADKALGIKSVTGGIDFYFATEQTANKMLNFLTSVIPCKVERSKKLKSHDIRSNIFNFKHSICVDIVPICKDDVVCLPSHVAKHCGGIGQIALVLRVTNNMFLIDPQTAQMAEIDQRTYYKTPFNPLASSKRCIKFTVIEIQAATVIKFSGQGQVSRKHKVADVWVQRTSELGVGETLFCRSHLGKPLRHGDTVLGYDLRSLNPNDENLDKIDSSKIPDVVLVRKKYRRRRRRNWRMKHLARGAIDDDDLNSMNKDYIDFIEDIEEDEDLRKHVNIYRKADMDTMSEAESDVDDMTEIPLEEMLEDLAVDEEEPDDEPPAFPEKEDE